MTHSRRYAPGCLSAAGESSKSLRLSAKVNLPWGITSEFSVSLRCSACVLASNKAPRLASSRLGICNPGEFVFPAHEQHKTLLPGRDKSIGRNLKAANAPTASENTTPAAITPALKGTPPKSWSASRSITKEKSPDDASARDSCHLVQRPSQRTDIVAHVMINGGARCWDSLALGRDEHNQTIRPIVSIQLGYRYRDAVRSILGIRHEPALHHVEQRARGRGGPARPLASVVRRHLRRTGGEPHLKRGRILWCSRHTCENFCT